MGDEDFIRRSLFMIGGLLVWAVHFGLVYGFNSLACTRGFAGQSFWGVGLVPFVISAATLAALLATGVVMLLAWRRVGPARAARTGRPVDGFMRYCAITIGALSLAAIAWNGIPALIMPPCS